MKKTSVYLVAVLAAGIANVAHAAGDPVAGRAKAAGCAGCHGADGNSLAPVNPKLAGQHEQVLVDAMMAYKNGKREHAVMKAFLGPLSEQDIADLAAYYAVQSCK